MSQNSSESRGIELETVARLSKYYSADYIAFDLRETRDYEFEIHHTQNGLIGIGEASWPEVPLKKYS